VAYDALAFESNGYAARSLFAVDFSFPQAREDDALPMTGRSGTDDQLRELRHSLREVLAATGAAASRWSHRRAARTPFATHSASGGE
jgi:hypothetical protein